MGKALEHFTRPMFRIRCAASISAKEKFAVFKKCGGQQIKCLLYVWPAYFQGRIAFNQFIKMRGHECGKGN